MFVLLLLWLAAVGDFSARSMFAQALVRAHTRTHKRTRSRLQYFGNEMECVRSHITHTSRESFHTAYIGGTTVDDYHSNIRM